MGSGSSILSSSSSSSTTATTAAQTPRQHKVNRTKKKLASLICGSSSTSQNEECGGESLIGSSEYCQQKVIRSLSPINDSMSTSGTATGFDFHSSPRSGLISPSESSTMSSENASIQNDSRVESSNKKKRFLEGDEAANRGINGEKRSYQQRPFESINPSSVEQVQDASLSSNICTTTEIYASIGDIPRTSQDVSSPDEQSTCFEEVRDDIESQSHESFPVPVVSDPSITPQLHEDRAIQRVIPSGLEPFVPIEAESQPQGSLHHVDVVSISSNLLPNTNNEISTREERSSSRRMFLDAFSSRRSRRHADFPAILLTTQGSDIMGSHRRLLLGIGDDFFEDRVGDEPWHFGRRSHFMSDRRRSSRSEFRDRLRGVTNENSHHALCPYDLHPDGLCTCELDDEASALSSISRIILLAEALFEVLDEIHRQPDSLSLSMHSVPAPESIVDSLPLKTYEKSNTLDNGDVDQCHICLVEYEKGDNMRVLPCHHSYHMSCVDKWLKEVHGVCPLCRRDVQEGVKEVAASSSDAGLS